MNTPEDYIIAEGPEGLKKVLNDLWEEVEHNPNSAKQEHYILYQLSSQKSLIKIETDQMPFKFWCYDLMGRPITLPMREVLSQFLEEHWGKENLRLQDVTEQNK